MIKVSKKEMKERLYNYKKLKGEKMELELKYQELNEDIGIKAINYGNEGTSYGISNETERQAIKLGDQKRKINEFIKSKGIEILRIENTLSVLEERERDIVENRYVYNRNWEVIASKHYLSTISCRKIAGKALDKMLNIINYSI